VDLNSKITTSIAQAEENERENDDFFNTIVEQQPVDDFRLLPQSASSGRSFFLRKSEVFPIEVIDMLSLAENDRSTYAFKVCASL